MDYFYCPDCNELTETIIKEKKWVCKTIGDSQCIKCKKYNKYGLKDFKEDKNYTLYENAILHSAKEYNKEVYNILKQTIDKEKLEVK